MKKRDMKQYIKDIAKFSKYSYLTYSNSKGSVKSISEETQLKSK